MKLDKFKKLKFKLETLKLEKSYSSLNTVLYYFSFLGNIFLVYFGYFFIKNIVDTLPPLFPYQNLFLSIFVGLFLIGYELTKRFLIEQVCISIAQLKRLTKEIAVASVIATLLIAGSFYLSLNGAHRLIDSSEKITASIDSSVVDKSKEITDYYDKEISYYRAQPATSKEDRRYRDSIVNGLELSKSAKLATIDSATSTKSIGKLEINKENDNAFVFMTFFLEFIILLGVGFNAGYTIATFNETKSLLSTPKYKQIELNIQLLKLYYQNGKKQIGDLTLPYSKLLSLAKNQKLNCTQTEIRSFITYCNELDITKEAKNKRKEYQIAYDAAKKIIEKELSL
jgi:hypothetical protein